MLSPALAALHRRAQDLPPSPAAEASEPPAAARRAVLPALAEGQHEPMPATITFSEFLAGLNPLQHLPVVGTIYRAITGEVAPPAMRVAGGFLMGGPVGAIISAVSVTAEEIFSAAMKDNATPSGPPARPDQPAAPSRIAATTAGPAAPDAAERLARVRLAGEAYGRHGQGVFPAIVIADAGGMRALP